MENSVNYTIELLEAELSKLKEDLTKIVITNKERDVLVDKLFEDFEKGLVTGQKFNDERIAYENEFKEEFVRFDTIRENLKAIRGIVNDMLLENV